VNWVYILSEPQLWTVGYYDINGAWEPDSDHETPDAAAARVAYLNGFTSMPCPTCASNAPVLEAAKELADTGTAFVSWFETYGDYCVSDTERQRQKATTLILQTRKLARIVLGMEPE